MKSYRLSPIKLLVRLAISMELCTGCTSLTTIDTSTSTPALLVATSGTPSTPTVIASATQGLSPTASLTSTQLPRSTATTSVEKGCLPQNTELPAGFLAPSVMIFRQSKGVAWKTEDHLFSLSPPDFSLQPILESLARGTFYDFHVSHDGQRLAFIHEKLDSQGAVSHDLLVTTSNIQELKTIPWDEALWSYTMLGWLSNDEQLAIVPRGGSAVDLDSIIVFNPYTRQGQRIIPSFTYSGSPPLSDETWVRGRNVAYDPDLSRVLYLDNSTTIVLWDVQNKQELWRITDIYASAEFPEWSPDGEYVAIVTSAKDGNNELFLLSRDGNERISVLVADYPIDLFSFDWSPNGRYLAFLAPSPEGGDDRLLIFDRTTRKYIDPCFTSTMTWPVWSPDSNQFIVGLSEPNTERVYHNLVVNIEQKRIAPFNASTLPLVAWIKAEP